MPSLVRRTLLTPFWLAQVLTQEKFFARNPVIGSRWLNERGLHTARVTAAHRLAGHRRRRLAQLIGAADRERLDRDGYIVKRDFLPPDLFADLTAEIRQLRAPAREMVEGDTITRHIALDPQVLQRVPAARRLLAMPEYRNLIRYAGSSAAAPMVYIQTVLSHAVAGVADPQRDLHTDTFHPTVKAWLFLTDVAISRDELAELGLPQPQLIAAPANTLVVADTFGFHARGPSAQPTTRVEIWAFGRRNPFLPWTGLDPWSVPALGLRKPNVYWKSVDLLEKLRLGHQRWRPRAAASAFDQD
jgi:hypothetical protein